MGKMQEEKKSKTKRRREEFDSSTSNFRSQLLSNPHTTFPSMLACLANIHTPYAQTLLIKHLQNLHKSLNTLPLKTASFFSLLPYLLTTTKSPSIARKTAEIVGALALLSIEVNQIIASDVEILEALMIVLKRRKKKKRNRSLIAACNAVLDLCTTEFGRRRLCEVAAVEKLIIWRVSSSCDGERIEGDDLPGLLFEAMVILIKACSVEQLKKIPGELLEIFLCFLKELWVEVRNQSSKRNNLSCNVKLHDLAESIFRLSINSGHYITPCTPEVVKRSIFGPNQSDYEHFIFNYWEDSPFLFRASKLLNDCDHIFNFFDKSFKCKTTLDTIIPTIVGGLVSCPPLTSDELDILNFLKDLNDGLGSPIIYGQDIRVLKAVEDIDGPSQGNLKREVHFLKEQTGSSRVIGPDFSDMCDVQKCRIACQEGYTIALRGLEFRSEKIASVADGLAVMFGQPSVGANAYLTPHRSQGLARHYDDHCVFVCQLLGQKQWTVYPRLISHLPRLYESLDNVLGYEGRLASKCQQFLLEEGDVLYIPRGCPHEAFTTGDAGEPETNNAYAGFSFHLTLGIEVEPPFEWEGFAHIALHIWNQEKNEPFYTMSFMSINLLHVAIQQIGSRDPTFAKACMVATFSSHSDTRDQHQSNVFSQERKATFSYVINEIDKNANFLEVLKSIEVTVQEKNEDFFLRMRWMRHLYSCGDSKGRFDWDNPIKEFEDIFLFCNEHRSEAEASFMQVKSKFCDGVIFEDVCEHFEELLEKYRKARMQYMNGMLSLHCTSTNI